MAEVPVSTLLLLTAVSVPFILLPGPNVLVIIATTLSHGRHRGVSKVAGTSAAMIIQLAVAALGTATLVTELHNGLLWLKWAGVAYLLAMGISALRRLLAARAPAALSGMGSIRRGFLVSLTNPKTILFFSAFLPQFVSPQGSDCRAQLLVLAAGHGAGPELCDDSAAPQGEAGTLA